MQIPRGHRPDAAQARLICHICLRHGHGNPRHKAGDKDHIVVKKASKRLMQPLSVEQVLDDDLRRESKQAKKHPCDDIIDLGFAAPTNKELKLGMIPICLGERFHLATSTSSAH